jgi:hypothetical protein
LDKKLRKEIRIMKKKKQNLESSNNRLIWWKRAPGVEDKLGELSHSDLQ